MKVKLGIREISRSSPNLIMNHLESGNRVDITSSLNGARNGDLKAMYLAELCESESSDYGLTEFKSHCSKILGELEVGESIVIARRVRSKAGEPPRDVKCFNVTRLEVQNVISTL